MGWHMGNWSWAGWTMMIVLMLAFWAVVVAVVVSVWRRPRAARPPASTDPGRILAVRLATGEIDEDEYRRRRDALDQASRRPDAPSGGGLPLPADAVTPSGASPSR